MRRLFLGLVLATSVLVVSAPVVMGHECVIASRSAQGDAGALHSGRWVPLTLADVFGFIHDVVGGAPLSPAQIDEAVAMAVDQGLPEDGWVVRGDKTIGEGSKNPNLANGRGLDLLSLAVGEQIVGIYFAVLAD
jgi:hypothetical protein